MIVNVHGSVEVWCDFSQRWVDGFELTEHEGDTVVLARRSDGHTLPELPSERVRPSA